MFTYNEIFLEFESEVECKFESKLNFNLNFNFIVNINVIKNATQHNQQDADAIDTLNLFDSSQT